ncbi:MAG: hypothetical protein ACQETI_05050 [Halobacteriota archaeon]
MAVSLSSGVVERYERFTRFNSPYPAHDEGCAVDLYPATNDGISPVAGEVIDTRTVRAPPKPYAADSDHLILVDTGDYVARILHVEPQVEPGDYVEVGQVLGPMVRAGFFAPWVGNHVHLGFRSHGDDLYRARGSLPVNVEVEVQPLPWDGTGTVVSTGDTFVVLDAPAHPNPGGQFVAIAADDGTPLDGGLVHYAGGGTFSETHGSVSLFGQYVGVADGYTVAWGDVELLANGRRITGLSLVAARNVAFGAKLVCPGHSFSVGDDVTVDIQPCETPVRLTSG